LNTKYNCLIVFILVSLLHFNSVQIKAQTIQIQGKIMGEEGESVVFPIIANQSTSHGVVADGNGRFTIAANKSDTILINATGYNLFKFCLHDSLLKESYQVEVHLTHKVISLKEFIVHDIKTIADINKEKEKLGIKNVDAYKNVDGFNSPITWLYERFSKQERDKRLVATLENKDRQIAVLKDLFRNYISYDIIDLNETEFEDFIDYLQLPESYIKTASDYELAMNIKYKYLKYRKEQSTKY
jgi:3-dehydroquinate dehydratase